MKHKFTCLCRVSILYSKLCMLFHRIHGYGNWFIKMVAKNGHEGSN